MLFRATIAISYIIFVINVAEILHLDRFNPIQKSIFLVAALVYVFTRPVDKRIIGLLLACSTMIVLLGALTDYPDFQWSLLFGAFNQFIVPYLLLAGQPSEKDRMFFLKLSVWLAPLSSVMGLFYQTLGIYNAFPIEFNTGEPRFSGTLNAAFLGGFAAIGIFAAFKLTERGFRAYGAAIFLNFAILILSAGRMNLAVIILIMIPSFFLSNAISRATKMKASIIGVVGSFLVAPLIWLKYADRFEKSGNSGRNYMWDWLFDMSAQYPDFGIGFGHQFWATPQEVLVFFSSSAAHNDYLRLLVELGWFGVFGFYGLLILAVVLVWRGPSGRKDISVLAALVGYLLWSATDNALATPSYFTIVVAAVMAAQARTKTESHARMQNGRPEAFGTRSLAGEQRVRNNPVRR